jgi:pre-mRNA-splicing factor CDC5/CEF1
MRLQGARAGVRLGLGQLPEPHNKFQLAGGGAEEDGEAEEALEEEDAADRDARRARALEDAKAHSRAMRSSVIRRELPRPAGPPAGAVAAVVGVGGLTAAAYKAAEAVLRDEVVALIEHDNTRYAVVGRSAKKRRRRLEALAEVGPSPLERSFAQEELAEAAGAVANEAEELRERYGHGSTTTAALVEMMQASYAEHECALCVHACCSTVLCRSAPVYCK